MLKWMLFVPSQVVHQFLQPLSRTPAMSKAQMMLEVDMEDTHARCCLAESSIA
eukprot:SAG31_NODE_1970_length_6766_cov_88.154792_2_plen_53_part_00